MHLNQLWVSTGLSRNIRRGCTRAMGTLVGELHIVVIPKFQTYDNVGSLFVLGNSSLATVGMVSFH
jgi:hypothetical protein